MYMIEYDGPLVSEDYDEPEYDPDDYEQAQNYCADSLDLVSFDRY